jgi:hypothetical protein
MSMSVGERDKKMSDMASIAAEAFCDKHTSPSISADHIREHPERFLDYTIPYLTVRTLHRHEEALARHEKALASLEADSRWIKRLTLVLVLLTLVLAYYAFRLDTVIHSLQSNASPTPSPTAMPSPTATTTP